MLWIFRYFLACVSFTNLVTAEDQCRIEINIRGMTLKGFVFKRMTVAAPHICDFLCEREITCQSYNFNRKEQICELNNRTKDARPENFRSDPAWFYIRRLNGRGNYSANNVDNNYQYFRHTLDFAYSPWFLISHANRYWFFYHFSILMMNDISSIPFLCSCFVVYHPKRSSKFCR